MAETTGISWTDSTFNPWMGCTNVSPACDHCYAEKLVTGRMGLPVWGHAAPRQRTSAQNWQKPLGWDRAASASAKRRRVFCGSLCDVMEERADLVPWRDDLYSLIEKTPWLDWLLLTKRPQNFRRFLPPSWVAHPPKNVWGMTTVESPQYLWRIDALRAVPFIVHGVSIEPLLEDIPAVDLTDVEWVIVGGESGPGARPMHPDWARRIRDACLDSGVAFHFKQWGDWAPDANGVMQRVGKYAAGNVLDGREWQEFPA